MIRSADDNHLIMPEVHRNSSFELLRIIAMFGVICSQSNYSFQDLIKIQLYCHL